MIKQEHLNLLLQLNADENPHSGRKLLDHLRGTRDLLKAWGNDQEICLGGLFHSIYGRQSYKTESAALEDRQRVRELIGKRPERLAFLFGVTNRSEFFDELGMDRPTLRDRVHNEILLKKLQDMYGKEFDPIMKMAEIAASMGTPEDMNDAQKKQAVDAWEKIAQYVTPRLKAVEVAHAEGQQFVIQVKR